MIFLQQKSDKCFKIKKIKKFQQQKEGQKTSHLEMRCCDSKTYEVKL